MWTQEKSIIYALSHNLGPEVWEKEKELTLDRIKAGEQMGDSIMQPRQQRPGLHWRAWIAC